MSSRGSSRREHLQGLLKKCKDGSGMKERAENAKRFERRLFDKYAPATADELKREEFRQRVQNEISNMFRQCSRIKITESHLRELEDKVRAIAIKTGTEDEIDIYHVINQQGERNLELERGELPLDDYQVLVESDRIDYLFEQQRKKQQELSRKVELRKVLDAQCSEIKRSKEKQRQEAEKYREEIRRKCKEHDEYEKQSRQKKMELHRKDKELREQQLRDRRIRAERVKARAKREDDEQLLLIKEQLANERERQKQRISQQRAYINKVTLENEHQKRLRAEQRKKEWAEDKRRNEEYAQRLEKEEAARNQALLDMKKRSSRNQEMFMAATAHRTAKEQSDADAVRRHQEKRFQEEERRHAEKRAKQAEDMKLIKESLQEQIARKEREAEEAKRAFQEAALEAKEAAREEQKQHEEKARRKRLDQLRFRSGLQEQMREKELRQEREEIPTKMRQDEQLMNATEFRKLAQDKQKYELIKQSFRARPKQVLKEKKKRAHLITVKSDYF